MAGTVAAATAETAAIESRIFFIGTVPLECFRRPDGDDVDLKRTQRT
jgi:hypothetical protein